MPRLAQLEVHVTSQGGVGTMEAGRVAFASAIEQALQRFPFAGPANMEVRNQDNGSVTSPEVIARRMDEFFRVRLDARVAETPLMPAPEVVQGTIYVVCPWCRLEIGDQVESELRYRQILREDWTIEEGFDTYRCPHCGVRIGDYVRRWLQRPVRLAKVLFGDLTQGLYHFNLERFLTLQREVMFIGREMSEYEGGVLYSRFGWGWINVPAQDKAAQDARMKREGFRRQEDRARRHFRQPRYAARLAPVADATGQVQLRRLTEQLGDRDKKIDQLNAALQEAGLRTSRQNEQLREQAERIRHLEALLAQKNTPTDGM